MKRLLALLGRLFAHRRGQRFLDISLRVNLWLMGIGAGADPGSSGEAALIARLRGTCVLDVGANKGQFATMMLAARGELQVHCFEPGAAAFQVLTQTHGQDPRVVLNNVGVGSEPGTRTLFYDSPGSVLASVYKRRLDYREIPFDRSEVVRMTTLDEYCAKLPRIHLLKLDVEGHEMDVLKGATETLPRVDMVSFEFGGSNLDSRTFWRDFYFFFTERGFGLFRIGPTGYFFPVTEYREWHEQFSTTNYVAIRDAVGSRP
jgi:FkbM family methyltransferase